MLQLHPIQSNTSTIIFNLGEATAGSYCQTHTLAHTSLHVTHHKERFVPWSLAHPCMLFFFSPLAHSSVGEWLRPNERVLSYEAVRLPHTVTVTKERTSALPHSEQTRERDREMEDGGVGGKGVSWGCGWLTGCVVALGRECDTQTVICQRVKDMNEKTFYAAGSLWEGAWSDALLSLWS